jgi:hypothetical protein
LSWNAGWVWSTFSWAFPSLSFASPSALTYPRLSPVSPLNDSRPLSEIHVALAAALYRSR